MDSNKIKKGLGRGLSSLIGEAKVDVQKNKISIYYSILLGNLPETPYLAHHHPASRAPDPKPSFSAKGPMAGNQTSPMTILPTRES